MAPAAPSNERPRPNADAAGEAGGGHLLAVYDGAVRVVSRRAGDATVHPSSLLHGVSRMREGSRYTLILFFENEDV